jgi:uncharacterized protein YpbB
MYQLFGVLPRIQRNDIDQAVDYLKSLNLIQKDTESSYRVTSNGEEKLQFFHLPASLNGYKYDSISTVFWERLSLTVQSLSNLIHYETRFFPIHRDPPLLKWVKSFLKGQPLNREQLGEKLYEELIRAFLNLDEQKATIFVSKLTSHHRIGLTNEQLSDMFKKSKIEINILFLSTIHYLLTVIEEEGKEYPLLSTIATMDKNYTTLTKSTEKTYELLSMGKSIDEIAKLRYLKRNTIEDHIVEIVLSDESFDVKPFITTENYEMIKSCIQAMNTNQLKSIKQALSIPVSYFEIRLVLARVGGIHEA